MNTTLAIDVGNTTAAFGLFERGRLVRRFAIPTHPLQSSERLARQLRWVDNTDQVILCSVVPPMTTALVQAFRRLGSAPVQVVGKNLIVPLQNRYRHPQQVGQDRLVGAYAALRTFKRDCIVCDFGTAVTIDIVKAGRQVRSPSPRAPRPAPLGVYLGGVIVPGLEISLDALATRTALLPRVQLREPPELLGRDTVNSIRSGLLFGYGALCDGLVRQLKRQYAPGAVVVATGGGGLRMARYATCIDHVRPSLVLEGAYQLGSPQGS